MNYVVVKTLIFTHLQVNEYITTHRKYYCCYPAVVLQQDNSIFPLRPTCTYVHNSQIHQKISHVFSKNNIFKKSLNLLFFFFPFCFQIVVAVIHFKPHGFLSVYFILRKLCGWGQSMVSFLYINFWKIKTFLFGLKSCFSEKFSYYPAKGLGLQDALQMHFQSTFVSCIQILYQPFQTFKWREKITKTE